MIEVEIEFPLVNGNEEKLLRQAEFVEEIIIKDVYFDRDDFELTLTDKWLRMRDGKFELKVPANPEKVNALYEARRYEELTSEEEIAKVLGIEISTHLRTELKERDYKPFASLKSNRMIYRDDEFRIDIDKTDFGYMIGEIELLVDDPAKTAEAEKKLHDHLAEKGVSYHLGHIGKVAHYLQRHNPVHFCKLVEAGVISPDKNRKWCDSVLHS